MDNEKEQNSKVKKLQTQTESVKEDKDKDKIESNQKENTSQVYVQPLKLNEIIDTHTSIEEEGSQTNFNLLMGVSLEVTVEIGRTKKQVREILDIRQGSIVELDKQASEPVDVMVNGQLIARGDVVVIDDNFGVRITQIVSNKVLAEKIS